MHASGWQRIADILLLLSVYLHIANLLHNVQREKQFASVFHIKH